MAVLALPFYLQFVDNAGIPVAGGSVYTFAAGTTTPKATFTDFTEATQAPNPIILDAAGRCTMWITGAYKFRLTDAMGVLIRETDNVIAYSTPAGAAEPFSQTFSGNGSNVNFTLSKPMGTDSLGIDVYVDNSDGKGYNILLPSQYTINGTALTLTSAPATGTNNIYVKAPSTLLGKAALSAQAAETSATNAAASASQAATAIVTVQNYAAALKGTSTTSLTIGTGTQVFVTQADKQWSLGQRLRAASNDGVKVMEGEVTAYTGTSLTLNIDYTENSGIHASWNISLTGSRGSTGPAGSVANTDLIQAASSAGTTHKSSVGTNVATFGAGNTQDAEFFGGVKFSPRLQSVTSSATVTPTSNNDLVKITAQAAGLTIANPTGTMTEGQILVIRIKDNGTARTISWGTNYRAVGTILPTTTVINKTLYAIMIWNANDTKYDITSVVQEA